jgi:hypothetical protein
VNNVVLEYYYMANSMFQTWLRWSLSQRGIDVQFESFLLSLLTENDPGYAHDYIRDALHSLAYGNDDDIDTFSDEILAHYLDSSRYDGSIVNCKEEIVVDDVQLKEEYVDYNNDAYAYAGEYYHDSDEIYYNDEGVAMEVDASVLFGTVWEEAEDPTLQVDDELCASDENLMEELDWTELADLLEALLAEGAPSAFYSPEAVVVALKISDGDVHSAYEAIITAEAVAGRIKPCRHLLTGRCMRRDCMFDHDLAHITCRYWLTSGCQSEGLCPFLHDMPRVAPSVKGPDTSQPIAELTADMFPALPSRPRAAPTPASVYVGPVLEFRFSRSRVVYSSDKKYVPQLERSENARPAQSSSSSASSKPGKRLTIKIPTAWVASGTGFSLLHYTVMTILIHIAGSALAATYKTLRAKARTLAISRNKLLEQATKAYMRSCCCL